jgi:hypothetical protein
MLKIGQKNAIYLQKGYSMYQSVKVIPGFLFCIFISKQRIISLRHQWRIQEFLNGGGGGQYNARGEGAA